MLSILKAVLGIFGPKIANYLLGFTLAAVTKAEELTLTAEESSGLDEKQAKQALRDKKRNAAVADIKGSLGVIDAIVPDAGIHFFVEVIILAQKFGFVDLLQKAVKGK